MELKVFWLIITITAIFLLWLAFYASKYKVPIIYPFKSIPEPRDHRIVVESANDLLRLEESGITPYKGLIIFCLEHNGVYLLNELEYYKSDSWQKLGGD